MSDEARNITGLRSKQEISSPRVSFESFSGQPPGTAMILLGILILLSTAVAFASEGDEVLPIPSSMVAIESQKLGLPPVP